MRDLPTDEELREHLTHDRLIALSRSPWGYQAILIGEALGYSDALDRFDDDWAGFGQWAAALRRAYERVVGVAPNILQGLRWLCGQHASEVEYECIKLGLRLRDLGTDRLTWRDLYVIAKHVEPGTPLAGVISADMAWTRGDHLIADVFDAIRAMHWGSAGHAEAVPDEYLHPRPGDVPKASPVEHHRSRAEHYAQLKQKQLEAA